MTNLHIDIVPTEGDAPEWFEAAALELSVKQSRLEEDFGVGRWPTWKADLAAGQLAFLDEAGPRVVCHVQVAGSTGASDWLWAWANNGLPAEIRGAAEDARAFGEAYKVTDLAEAKIASSDLDALGWRLAAAAAKITGADGVYRAPTQTGAIYLLMFDVEAVGGA